MFHELSPDIKKMLRENGKIFFDVSPNWKNFGIRSPYVYHNVVYRSSQGAEDLIGSFYLTLRSGIYEVSSFSFSDNLCSSDMTALCLFMAELFLEKTISEADFSCRTEIRVQTDNPLMVSAFLKRDFSVRATRWISTHPPMFEGTKRLKRTLKTTV